MQGELLHSPVADLPHIQIVLARQSMALTVPNSFGSFPALPNFPRIFPFNSTL